MSPAELKKGISNGTEVSKIASDLK